MFRLLNKCHSLHLPVDTQIDLFDKTVSHILLYGSELREYENIEIQSTLFNPTLLVLGKFISDIKLSDNQNCQYIKSKGKCKYDHWFQQKPH